jgi:ABC-type multidrug transport system ATPase subunit
LPEDQDFLRRYPSQISVGQAQRVLIAMAVLHRPALLIADEPTSALDMVTQAEILQLFASLSVKFGISILYISHDLLSVATIAHRVAVMHEGEIVECRRTAELFRIHSAADSGSPRDTAPCSGERRRSLSLSVAFVSFVVIGLCRKSDNHRGHEGAQRDFTWLRSWLSLPVP